MASQVWSHECRLYRPGLPGREIVLRLRAGQDGSGILRMSMRVGDDAPTHAEVSLPSGDTADLHARLLREIERRIGEGYQQAGMPLPAAPPAVEISPATQARLLAQLDPDQWRLLSPSRRARVAWRMGELRIAAAAASLERLIGSGDALLDYCLAWALGRCGSAAHIAGLTRLAERVAPDDDVRALAARRMARLAWLELAPRDTVAPWLQSLVEDWPAVLRTPWQTGDDAALREALANPRSFERITLGDWLEQLDLVARTESRARALLLEQLRSVPIAAGCVRALRHLYKAAEMRGDGEMWALLALRFETSAGSFPGSDSYVVVDRKWAPAKPELMRKDARIAWSRRTRDYMVRRSWRNLRRLGASQSPEYVVLASAALQAFDDAKGAEPGSHRRSHYDYAARRWHHEDRFTHAWPRSTLFNRLLFRPGGSVIGNRAGSTWWSPAALPDQPAQREECFPALWDARPDLLLRLMLEARSARVHAFAATALREQSNYLALLDEGLWLRLLNSVFATTAQFAFACLRLRIEADPAPEARLPWLRLLLRSRHESIWQAALQWISDDPAAYARDDALLAAMLLAPAGLVRRQARLLLQAGSNDAEVMQDTCERVLCWVEELDAFGDNPDEIASDLAWALTNTLRPVAAQVDHARLVRLLAHEVAAAQIIAVDWLLLHDAPVGNVPADAYKALLEAADERVQAAGVRLFGALPEAVLITQAELVARFCAAASPLVRGAATPLSARLGSSSAAFSSAFVAACVDHLFRAEPAEGVHGSLFDLLTVHFPAACDATDTSLLVRLATSRSRGGQRFADWALARRDDIQLRNEDCLALCRCDSVSLRARSAHLLEERYATRTLALNELIAALGTRWDETRGMLISTLRNKVPDDAWLPDQLIGLCDHLHPEVQALGRELLLPRLHGEAPLDYLLPLTEHPAPRMQAFVAQWLRSSLLEDAQLLVRLRPYFLAVLSQVNRGRAAKTQVQTLLRELAQRSETFAAEVATLFERLVVTVAISDRAQYVAGLYEIRARYPAIASGLQVQAPAAHERSR